MYLFAKIIIPTTKENHSIFPNLQCICLVLQLDSITKPSQIWLRRFEMMAAITKSYKDYVLDEMSYSDNDGSERSSKIYGKENVVLSATNQRLILQELRVEEPSRDTKRETAIEAIQRFSQHSNNKTNSQKPYEFSEAKTNRAQREHTRKNRLEPLPTICKTITNTKNGDDIAILPSMGISKESKKDPGKSE